MDYQRNLEDLFNGSRTVEEISEVVDRVLSEELANNVCHPYEQNLESMIVLLCRSGNNDISENTNNFEMYFDQLLNIFSDISPDHLRQVCRKHNPFDFEAVIDELSTCDYVKAASRDPQDILKHLKEILPNVDPSFLHQKALLLANLPESELLLFVQNALDEKDLPTLEDYLRKKKEVDELSLYTTNFTVSGFLECIPNPVEFFSAPDRLHSFVQDEHDEKDVECALTFLYNHFCFVNQKNIKQIFKSCKLNLVNASSKLKIFPRNFARPRKSVPEKETKNLVLLQEMAFVRHEKMIKQVMKQENDRYRKAFEEAKLYGLLQTCNCCFDDQLIPDECYFCNKNCTFCKECVKAGAEQVIGKMETVFPCLNDCDAEFDYSTLHMVLDKKVFKRLCQRKQMEEIKSADIDGLEMCPFCDFSMIPVECDKTFKCGNEECGKESCRECWHESHIPLKCSEIEFDEDVRMRTYIENKMTEALLRTCWRCSKKFYKGSGCNKMTCVCGAKMCYLCGIAVTAYDHFDNGGCSLYTEGEDLQKYHQTRILQGANAAKAELGINADPSKLKIDPTKTFLN